MRSTQSQRSTWADSDSNYYTHPAAVWAWITHYTDLDMCWSGSSATWDCGCLSVTYMSILVQEVESVQIYSQDARGLDGGGARTLDVEEGGAEHGEGTDQTWVKQTHQICVFSSTSLLIMQKCIKIIGVSGGYCHVETHTELRSYQETVHGPGVGSRAGSAACVEWPYSANAVNLVCRRTAGGRTPARHV